jgi:predicted ATPase
MPFFVLEFLRSLVESRLLKYSLREKMWIWDSDKIGCEDMTDNVLCLLSRKMASFPTDIQLALQVLSCFGRTLDGIVVEYLSLTAEYSDIRSRLEHLDSEGCVQKVGTSDFKFVHDKVREAAYNLIPYNEKSQVRVSLGNVQYFWSSCCTTS